MNSTSRDLEIAQIRDRLRRLEIMQRVVGRGRYEAGPCRATGGRESHGPMTITEVLRQRFLRSD